MLFFGIPILVQVIVIRTDRASADLCEAFIVRDQGRFRHIAVSKG